MPRGSATALSPARNGRSARERLLAAALALLETEAPVSLSLDAIRIEAGVSVGALYHHFRDKATLIDALYLELLQQVQEQFLTELGRHAAAKEGIEAIVAWYLRWVTENRAGARLLLGHRPDDVALRALNRGFFAEANVWWQTHVAYGTLRALPLDVIHALWLGPAQEYCRHWLTNDVKRLPRNVAGVLADAAWNNLKEAS